MHRPVVVIFVALGFTSVLSTQPTNCSSRNEGLSISGGVGVCKADYGSRFNIDSKELMGTTCVSRNRGINKLLSARLKQALERMKQDFQQLQDLIDQEVSICESEPFGPVWRSGSLNVHRDYQKEQKSNADKMARYYNEPSIGTNVGDILTEEDQGQGAYHAPTNYFGQTGYLFDNSSKALPDTLDNRSKMVVNTMRREPLSEYNPRTAYEQQRILADIRIEPEINEGHSSADGKEKNKFAEPEVPLPAIGLNPQNFGF